MQISCPMASQLLRMSCTGSQVHPKQHHVWQKVDPEGELPCLCCTKQHETTNNQLLHLQSSGKERILCLTATKRKKRRGFKGALHLFKVQQGHCLVIALPLAHLPAPLQNVY